MESVSYLREYQRLKALVSQRQALMIPVASHKWHGSLPIENQTQEAVLWKDCLEIAHEIGLPWDIAYPFMLKQIAASKRMQQNLFLTWSQCPPPSLVNTELTLEEVRKKILDLNRPLLTQLQRVIRNSISLFSLFSHGGETSSSGEFAPKSHSLKIP